MPRFEVMTPLRNGGEEPVAPGSSVELDEKEGAALVAIGAVRRLAAAKAETPVDPNGAGPTVEQLARQGKAKLAGLAAAEAIALPEGATATAMAMLIVEARAAKAAAGAVTDGTVQ